MTRFPPGTPVRVRQTVRRREHSYEAQVIGVVEAWEGGTSASGGGVSASRADMERAYEHMPAQEASTARGHPAGQKGGTQLTRLKLRKADGELTLLVIDDSTTIARLEARPRGDTH